MCLTCGCLEAHKEMTNNDVTYEDVKRAADQNGVTADQVRATIGRTVEKDRDERPAERTRLKNA